MMFPGPFGARGAVEETVRSLSRQDEGPSGIEEKCLVTVTICYLRELGVEL